MVPKLAVAVGLVAVSAGSAGAWEVIADPWGAWTVTTIRELGFTLNGASAIVSFADDPTQACAALGQARLASNPNAAMPGYPGPSVFVSANLNPNDAGLIAPAFGMLSFARVHNVRIYVRLGNVNGECAVTQFHTCFDANSCPVPPAPNP
jgi:hypothetical protein